MAEGGQVVPDPPGTVDAPGPGLPRRRPQAGGLTGTYVACLDCGKEFPYDWQEMKVITSQAESRQYVASLATKQAA